MKAVIFDPTRENNFALTNQDSPVAGAGEVLLDMRAATLNFRDFIVRSNPVSPYSGDARGRVAGSDGVGIASKIGPDVRGIELGGRYMPSFFPDWIEGPPVAENLARHLGASASGVMAEQIVQKAVSLVAAPDHLTDIEAAALPCAGVTAWASLVMYGRAQPDQTILVQGTGGVSIFALQIAKLLGLKVIVTSSSDEKLARAKNLGADVLINYRTNPDWAEAAIDATHGRGVDHLIDVGGEATMPQSLQAMAYGGNLSLVGVLGGFGGAIDGMGLRGRILHLHTVFVESRAALQQLSDFVGEHRMRPIVDQVFPMEQANQALDTMLSGTHFGKIGLQLSA